MTRLALMSDLHIDLNRFTDHDIARLKDVLKAEKISHLHLLGDISNHFHQLSLPFMNSLETVTKVSFNLGNHDMLDLSEAEINAFDFQIHKLTADTVLLSFSGWYDYSFSAESLEKIRQLKETFWFDRRLKRSKTDQEICYDSLVKLDQFLENLRGLRVIVGMHFVPHKHFLMTHPKFTPFNAFLGSQKFHDVFRKHGVTDVVFGHAHRSYGHVLIDQVNYHSRPLGYIREWDLTIDFVNQNPSYNPTGTWNLSKRYNAVKQLADFQTYKTKQFSDELRHAMTIFDL